MIKGGNFPLFFLRGFQRKRREKEEEEDLGFRGEELFRVLISLDDREAEMLSGSAMRKSFKDSLKVLEADIQHANTLYVLLLSFIIIIVISAFGFFVRLRLCSV